jgi:hypothetical protein
MRKTYKDSFLIPITFGITGHRDVMPQDLERAKLCITKVVKSYRLRFPTTPLLFLSPLAEGADCLAAQAALDADENVFLQTIYPFQISEYKKTMSVDAQRHFEELHHHDRTIGFHIVNTEAIALTEAEKNLAYRRTGEFVATNSHVLFALKNKSETEKIGGTAEIVSYRKRGCVHLIENIESNIQCAEKGLLYEICVRRESDSDEPPPTVDDDQYFITPTNDGDGKRNIDAIKVSLGVDELTFFKRIWLSTKRLFLKSSDSIALPSKIEAVNKKSKLLIANFRNTIKHKAIARDWQTEDLYAIVEFEKNNGIPNENLYTQHIKGVTSSLATEYQRKYRLCLYFVFGLSMCAGLLLSFESYFEAHSLFHAYPILKYLFSGAALAIWAVGHLKDYKHTYEDFRALSEALRTQHFWFVARSTKSPADFFLSTQIDENSWLRRAIRTAWLMDYPNLVDPKAQTSADSLTSLHKLKHSWIDDQHDYLTKKIADFTKKEKYFGRLTLVLFITAVLLLLLGNQTIYSKIGPLPIDASAFKALGAAVLVLLALVKIFIEINAYTVLIKRFESSLHVYSQSKKVYQQIERLVSTDAHSIDKIARLQDLYQTLGRFALAELSDWYIVNSRIEFKNTVTY